jgi:peptidoglycan/xylan/chitin deacetylase (PgdA/CDA1 family)
MSAEKTKNNFVVCLSHDVDRTFKSFQFITHFLSNLKSGNYKSALYHLKSIVLKNHYWGFDRIIDIEESFKVKSTFFFLNESYPFTFTDFATWKISLGYYNIFDDAIRNIIKRLDSGGWEIGVHGSYNSFMNVELLKKEKRDIEAILGHEVKGIRQHFLNLNDDTWFLQREAGFKYDSSYGSTDDIGFKNDRYNLFALDQNKDFFIVPLVIMDTCLMSKKDPLGSAIPLVELAEKEKGCLVLNWHQRMFCEREFPGYAKLYIDIIEECQKRDARFLTIGEYVCENGKKAV